MTSYRNETTEAIERRRMELKNQLKEMEDELQTRNVHVHDADDEDAARTREGAALVGTLDVTPRYRNLENPVTAQETSRSSRSKGSGAKTARSITGLVVTDEEQAEQMRHHFDYPEIHSLVFIQIGMSLGYCAYTTTSWLYVGSVRNVLFPDCGAVWSDPLLRWTCETTVLAFWTFPLFCCFFLICFFYRDLLCTRLYYEMLAHNVFLDFENVEFMDSSAVRLLMVWMIVALCMYPMSGAMFSLSETVYVFRITVAYWLPVFSFLGLLYTSWDLESRLLSLSKYVEREFDQAKDHMGNSVFMRDHLCEFAFHDVQTHSQQAQKVHTTGSYIRAIVKRAQSLLDEVHEDDLKKRKAGRSILHSRFLVVFSSTYWVSSMLYCPQLDDYRAQRFRKWFRVYKGFTYFLLLFIAYLTLATIVSHLHLQHLIETSWLTEWFNVEHFLIVPVGGQPPPKTSFLQRSFHFLAKQI
eukprot:gnl/MRDRNA2_/MRDRNA2_104623_c0_seq1.p1 gnl/MRDRNA2_/MRDRNA2_104623_c0~~gnl/MRDRNA2_/MRDRNA2_104623_c0_seq1.p1  ORF type:complete len:468 (-),score=69.75 gnl/MRDRNA2_/MRDRNA2_104623_c0_seq1:3-1406(-)